MQTQPQFVAFPDVELVQPAESVDGPVFNTDDLARLDLLSNSAEHFDLAADAPGIVILLIDQPQAMAAAV